MLDRRRATALHLVQRAVRRPCCAALVLISLAGAALAAAALLGPGAGRAQAAQLSPAAQRAVHYLERAQNPDGGLGQSPGASSDELFAGWAALGLASAGVDIGSLRHGPGDRTLLHYVDAGAGAHDVGSLERTILVVRAAGHSPSAVDGHDLVGELVRRFTAGGSIQRLVNLTAFGLLALRAGDVASTAGVQARAARWLAGQHDRDGGYGFAGRGGESDADDTGAVLEAFGADRSASVRRARRGAVAFLRRDEDGDGGFSDGPGAGSNTQSTTWAVQGLIAAGVAPASLRRDGHTPLSYLSSLVGATGAVHYARDATETPVWVTGEVLMGLTGTPLPFVPAPAAGTGASAARHERSPSASTRGHRRAVGARSRRRAPHRTRRRRPSRPSRPPGPPGAVRGRARAGGGSAAVSRAVRRMEAAVSALPGSVLAHAGIR